LNWIAGLFGSARGEISGQATAPSSTLPAPSASDLGAISHYPRNRGGDDEAFSFRRVLNVSVFDCLPNCSS